MSIIQTNLLALNSHRNLKNVNNAVGKTSARLSSGYRINSAADDAAGLAISEKMRAQIKGLDQASRNAQDAISLVQTAEGGMQEIDNMIQRMRELVVQASNGTNEQAAGTDKAQGDRQKIQDEITQLTAEIDNMSERTEFNKKKIINGDYGRGTTGQKATLKDELKNLNTAKAALYSTWEAAGTGFEDAYAKLLANAPATTTSAELDEVHEAAKIAREAYADLKLATTAADMTAVTAKFANATAKLTTTASATQFGTANHKAFKDFIDVAVATSIPKVMATAGTGASAVAAKVDAAKTAIKNSPTEGLYFQVGANAGQKIEVSIESVSSLHLGIGDGNGKSGIDVVKADGADITNYLKVLDKSLNYVTTERSKLGAVQNRLDYTIKSLDISSENLSASESRVRDADMAKEMMQLTKSNVLQQAATSILAQANQSPQSVLKLLG